jgi:cell wall-associated NlpC family hydrolase
VIVADAFVGKPWRLGATGPDAFDCWGLVVTALRDLFGQAVPDLAEHLTIASVVETPQIAAVALGTGRWRELPLPQAGLVIALRDLRGAVRHVGLCLGCDIVLHTRRGFGARLEPLRLVEAPWAAGRFYRWAP